MRFLIILVSVLSISIVAACDVQSGITKKSVEHLGPTPTPSISPTPTDIPIDSPDIVKVDTSVQGPTLLISRKDDRTNLVCNKYNRVMINSDGNAVKIKGACSQIMVNGDTNEITAEAVTEIVFNGADNKIRYTKFANGKRPNVVDNRGGNLAEKTSAADNAQAQ